MCQRSPPRKVCWSTDYKKNSNRWLITLDITIGSKKRANVWVPGNFFSLAILDFSWPKLNQVQRL